MPERLPWCSSKSMSSCLISSWNWLIFSFISVNLLKILFNEFVTDNIGIQWKHLMMMLGNHVFSKLHRQYLEIMCPILRIILQI